MKLETPPLYVNKPRIIKAPKAGSKRQLRRGRINSSPRQLHIYTIDGLTAIESGKKKLSIAELLLPVKLFELYNQVRFYFFKR